MHGLNKIVNRFLARGPMVAISTGVLMARTAQRCAPSGLA
ncbi:hypothetical protein PXO_05813 [Xanthomonas oryzae pv. oryzae PXO99A]|uniref:Uncharacterized protein n=1 Tax=Xanthomonas oryzae pv. oryzae (strain PXO99A) TaxID=360094 RepID=A0A0K0GGM1_XANOP|nr:hypothetical protein PXO_05813 [Xanthomonas oryzae pv. oryzae PXO99A]